MLNSPSHPATAPLRVLFVTPLFFPSMGGVQVHVYEVSHRLAAQGYNITVLTTATGKFNEYDEYEGVQVRRVRAWPANRDYYWAPGIFRAITQARWDIIHVQNYHTLVAPLAMLAALRTRTPYVVTFHSGGHSSSLRNNLRSLQWNVLRPLLARAQALICVSQFEADHFRRLLGNDNQRYFVVPNGVEPPANTGPLPPPIPGMILSIGRLERYKGHHRVLAALPKVIAQQPEARLRIVGSGPYEPELRRIIQDLHIEDRVEILSVPSEQRHRLNALFAEASVVVSLSDYESQGIAMVEAIALGRPVLVSGNSALSELAMRGLATAIPPHSSADEVATALVAQLRQPFTPQKVELPTWDGCAHALVDIYSNIVQRRVAQSDEQSLLPPVQL